MRRPTFVRRIAALTTLTLIGGVSIGGAPVADAQQHGGGDTGDLFADLVVILRDVDGVPILDQFEVPSEIEGETVIEYCVQPVSTAPLPDSTAGPIAGTVNPADGRTVYRIPLMGDDGAPAPAEGEEVEPCDPWPAYAEYVSEAELERLNMIRQPDANFQMKLDEVEAKLLVADEISLDGAGRITADGVALDAAPEHAAMFRSLMTTGTIPGLVAEPAEIDPFDTWMLAAASLGTASGKDVPITIDTVQYYLRIATAIPDDYATAGPWQVDFLSNAPADPEQFVDFGNFRYTRTDVFTGCATWLDVDTLTWQVSPILDLAGFEALPPVAVGGRVDNVAGFAQMADDVRKVIGFLHENDVIPGFHLDPVGENTCGDQVAALSAPAVDWGTVPGVILQTEKVAMSASAYLPGDGVALDTAQLRITIDADTDFTDGSQVTAVETGGSESIVFTPELGNLVGSWPAAGFALAPGDVVTAELDVTVAAGAPTGDYTMTLELVDLDAGDPADAVVATDVVMTTVQAAGLSVVWTSTLDYVAQGVNEPVTARVFNPDLGQDPLPGVSLRVTVDAPEDFLLASQVTAFSEAVEMPFVLDNGDLVGAWPLTDPLPVPYDESITWTLNIGEGAPTGIYRLELELVDGADAVVAGPAVSDFIVGFENGAPVVTITDGPALITNRTTAMFAFESSVATTRYECKLDNGVWEPCTSPVSVEGLDDGEHMFAVSTTLGGTAVRQWVVDTVAPTVEWVSMPPPGTSNRDAMFEFTTDGADEVLCSLDGAALTPCSDPVIYRDLELGDHQILVAAVDAAGNHASLTHRWRVAAAMAVSERSRLADTRSGWIADDGRFFGVGALPAGRVLEVAVAGRAGVPLDAEAAIVNVTVAGAQGSGFATVFPCGDRPATSSVNFQPGRDVANEVIAELSSRGTVCVYTHATADVIVDVVGFVPVGSDVTMVRPSRLADSRPSAVPAGGVLEVAVAGRAGVPLDAEAVIVNVTVAGAQGSGFATVFPCGDRPATSSVNFQPGRDVANEVIAELSSRGTVCVYTHATADVIVDVVGHW